MTKRTWTCPKCWLVFSRKWNLERHMKLIHESTQSAFDLSSNSRQNKKVLSHGGAFDFPSLGLKETFHEVYDFAEFGNNLANSAQAFNQINSLQWQVNSLQQQLASRDRYYNDLLSRYCLLPTRSIHGISGHLCEKCNSFSLKPIFDIGYDEVMQSRHLCNEPEYRRNYHIYQTPTNNENIDHWAGQLLTFWINNYTFIGKNLVAKDLTTGFNHFKQELNSEIAYQILGVPERFYLYSLKSNTRIGWMDKAVKNLGKKTPISDLETKDLVTRIKSTYGIFEIPSDKSVRIVSLILTD